MLTKEQAGDIFDRVRKLSCADEVEVLFSGGRFALTRFANNIIHQNVAEENHVISLRTVFSGRTARAVTNKFDDESLRQVVRASENLANLKKLKDGQFDKAYIDHEVAYHEQVLGAIDKVLIPSAQNAELKGLIEKVRPAFQAHLDHAKHVQADVGKK